ncbi:hypothetical protein FZC78_22020 [Rossellomorea vietnamensis]|uniref:Uncharacterized protein n=1 Tax=Rossellomorea vietnamensis TaxID=218284 RepID=A0A5D4NH12_9BACI|nr:three component ABC system middle component [Rossellomorea vietnamensis]TYS13250.1 hypothetical protein FZC78_22020 [Rossellomorea vietnamensis]
MGKLVEEVRLWNTPTIGAYLLWRFSRGYIRGHSTGDSPNGLLHFIAMPILLNRRLIEPITRKRSGLQSYVRSFIDNKNSDILFSIHDRVDQKKEYTLSAIDIGISQGLLYWDTESGGIHPRDIEVKVGRGKALKKKFKQDGDKAEILGEWFAQHDLYTVIKYLKVVL